MNTYINVSIMKKVIHVVLIICLISSTLIGCMGELDWTFNINDDYAIWRINSDNKVLMHNSSTIIRSVSEFCYDEKYIAVRCQNGDRYYLIDMDSDIVLGPMSIDEYSKQVAGKSIGSSEWIKTKYEPKVRSGSLDKAFLTRQHR